MLKGILRVLDEGQMQRLHEAILNVLRTTGLQIHGRFLLQALADSGCRVDFEKERAWFNPELVEKQIAAQRGRYRMVRSSLWYPYCRQMPRDDAAWPDDLTIDFGHGAPWILDYAKGEYRRPTQQDQVDMIRLGEALPEAKAVNAPFICSDFDPRMETIESSRLLLLNTTKPGWVGTSSGKEVKFLAELASLAAGGDAAQLKSQPPVFVHAYCTTSPLKIDTRSCDVLEQALQYGFPINFASMPILGATTPVTPAGSVIVAAAEILGGLTAASLLAPQAFFYGTSISAEMDMKTMQLSYCTPAAILTDAALHQLFRWHYGLVLCVENGYFEARAPGIQAAMLKTYRQMALGATAGLSLPVGTLDNGSVFSPTQAMIDLDMSRAMFGFSRGVEVSDETMAVDLINELEFCETRNYLDSDHTLRHFRNVLWDPMFLDRGFRDAQSSRMAATDEKMLRKADQAWRNLVAAQNPPEVSPAMRTEIDRIVEAARRELLA